ncbi:MULTISPECIES: 3'-5' exonuclease [Fusobacterium]|uniref:3'-5' exonuclease n=1 Tax=Fusobacterium TaxID=848 RepID=UPI0014772B91|nr:MULTISPECIES: 3'-5' exonuclease [Fusobacterium]NME36087.1 3'-5' exonuclease [Fusobacterium sp. FSA-380-WT-3A]
MKNKIVPLIIFDTETNGLTKNDSVLSISAIKVFYDIENEKFLKDYEEYDRYYFIKDGEEENKEAISVNGLTRNEIEKRREGCSYPKFFYEDIESFKSFCEGVNHFIGHNINFDLKYINDYMEIKYTFDTMFSNKYIIKIPCNYGFKNPRLSETAEFYEIDVNQYSFHSSLDDVKITAKIFRKMCKNREKSAITFINKN